MSVSSQEFLKVITIYGRPGCGACEQVKALLTKRGIEFAYMMADDAIIDDALASGIKALPIIRMNGVYVTISEVLK